MEDYYYFWKNLNRSFWWEKWRNLLWNFWRKLQSSILEGALGWTPGWVFEKTSFEFLKNFSNKFSEHFSEKFYWGFFILVSGRIFHKISKESSQKCLKESSENILEKCLKIFPKGPLYIGILKNTLVNVLKEIFEEFWKNKMTNPLRHL